MDGQTDLFDLLTPEQPELSPVQRDLRDRYRGAPKWVKKFYNRNGHFPQPTVMHDPLDGVAWEYDNGAHRCAHCGGDLGGRTSMMASINHYETGLRDHPEILVCTSMWLTLNHATSHTKGSEPHQSKKDLERSWARIRQAWTRHPETLDQLVKEAV